MKSVLPGHGAWAGPHLGAVLLAVALGACGGGGGGSAEAAEARVQPLAATSTTRTDRRPPRVYIKSPVSLGRYVTSRQGLAIAGTAEDDVGVVRITWSNDQGGSGTAAGTASWSATGIPLKPGTNRISVQAYDAAGKSARGLLIVSYTGSAAAPSAPAAPAANRAPAIGGTPPASVAAGTGYSFTPTASDPDGQSLSFSVRGAPAWARFNTANGNLSGTPGAADVGTTSGIVITASDGQAQSSLPAFSIAVVQGGSGSATVSWTPPDERTDGSTLTDLAGYHVRYGTNSAALGNSVEIRGAGISRYVVEGLTSGTWYFGVTAFDKSGRESSLSNLASKRIP